MEGDKISFKKQKSRVCEMWQEHKVASSTKTGQRSTANVTTLTLFLTVEKGLQTELSRIM